MSGTARGTQMYGETPVGPIAIKWILIDVTTDQSNIERMPASQHIALHDWLENYGLNVGAARQVRAADTLFTSARDPAVRLFLSRSSAATAASTARMLASFVEYYSKSRRLIEDVHHLLLRFGIFSLIREKTTAIGTRACKIQITDKDQILRFAQRIGFTHGCGQAAHAGGGRCCR